MAIPGQRADPVIPTYHPHTLVNQDLTLLLPPQTQSRAEQASEEIRVKGTVRGSPGSCSLERDMVAFTAAWTLPAWAVLTEYCDRTENKTPTATKP